MPLTVSPWHNFPELQCFHLLKPYVQNQPYAFYIHRPGSLATGCCGSNCGLSSGCGFGGKLHWFKDQDDAFAKAIPRIYQVLLEPKSDGDLYWAGVSADLFVGKALFSAVGAYQWGEFRLYNDTASLRRAVSAFLADLSVEGNLSDWCSLGAFVFVAGGDDKPLRDDLNAFVSIMPFNPRAAIFFDPEFLGRDEDAEKLTFNGGFFSGVIAPGLTLNLVSASGLSLETTVATFFAHQALDDGSRWYGWEVDLGVSYDFARFYTLYFEAARFEHGDYYESLLNEKIDPATRFSIGLRASF